MPTILIDFTTGLDAFYDYVMEYLDAKYHTYPPAFEHLYIPPELEAQISQYNAWAESYDAGQPNAFIPAGLQVYR